jgi:acetylornithine/succinyldiaminopimelate/putrescine aminotransferase
LLPLPAEQINQFGTVLAMRAMHLHGLHVCFTTNSSRVIRFTPALNMPIETFNLMFDRLETVAQHYHQAWKMLPDMPKKRLLDLVKMAMIKS